MNTLAKHQPADNGREGNRFVQQDHSGEQGNQWLDIKKSGDARDFNALQRAVPEKIPNRRATDAEEQDRTPAGRRKIGPLLPTAICHKEWREHQPAE